MPLILLDYDVDTDAIGASYGDFAADFYNLVVRQSIIDSAGFGRLESFLSLFEAGLSQELYGEAGAFRQALADLHAADAANGSPARRLCFPLARIDIPPEELARLAGLALVPGMPVEAFVQTGERTPISYLLKPITDQIARAMREE